MKNFDMVFSTAVSIERLFDFLIEIDGSFEPQLSTRVDLYNYAIKLVDKSKLYCFVNNENKIIACISVYCNNVKEKIAYIPIVGVLKAYRGQGLIKEMFKNVEKKLREDDFEFISLETWLESTALNLYIKNGYYIENMVSDRPNGGISVKLKKDLRLRDDSFNYNKTPLERSDRLSSFHNVNFFYKRDDMFQVSGGGSKGRKLKYILKKAKNQGCNAIVTTGSNQSNHIRATAVLASTLSMASSVIVHDIEPAIKTSNLKLTSLSGAAIRFVEMKDVKDAMDQEVVKFIKEGFSPFYIWGGGHCIEGAFAYYKAVYELKNQLKDIEPDFIIVPSGTGTTQAGIEIGVKELYPNCRVLGVSVARDKDKGSKAVIDSANELLASLSLNICPVDDVFFDDDFIGDSYGAVYPELIRTIRENAKEEGVFLDSTYSGKAFWATLKYIERGLIPKGSNVVFWHTGSLMNLLSSEEV